MIKIIVNLKYKTKNIFTATFNKIKFNFRNYRIIFIRVFVKLSKRLKNFINLTTLKSIATLTNFFI